MYYSVNMPTLQNCEHLFAFKKTPQHANGLRAIGFIFAFLAVFGPEVLESLAHGINR